MISHYLLLSSSVDAAVKFLAGEFGMYKKTKYHHKRSVVNPSRLCVERFLHADLRLPSDCSEKGDSPPCMPSTTQQYSHATYTAITPKEDRVSSALTLYLSDCNASSLSASTLSFVLQSSR